MPRQQPRTRLESAGLLAYRVRSHSNGDRECFADPALIGVGAHRTIVLVLGRMPYSLVQAGKAAVVRELRTWQIQ